MTVLLVLIPVSIGMGLVGLGAFIWALRQGQFEDPEGDAWRVIETLETEIKEGEPYDRLAPHADDINSAGRL